MIDDETAAPADAVGAELRDLVGRAERGDASVRAGVTRLSLTPGRTSGDRCRTWEGRAEEALLGLLGDNLLARESLSRRLAELKGELAGPGATAHGAAAGWPGLRSAGWRCSSPSWTRPPSVRAGPWTWAGRGRRSCGWAAPTAATSRRTGSWH